MCSSWPGDVERSERHTFHLAGDVDRLCIHPPGGKRYVIETVNLGARCDTVLTLSTWDGSIILEDDNGGGGLASRIVWTVPEQGVYWISVRHKDNTVYGEGTEYNLSIQTSVLP